jgi:predicted transcriptional regulator
LARESKDPYGCFDRRDRDPSTPLGCIAQDDRAEKASRAHNPVASNINDAYHHDMAKANKFEVEPPDPVIDDEDEETLAAIDEGIRDAEAGRTVPSEAVRKLLPQWISASSTPIGR